MVAVTFHNVMQSYKGNHRFKRSESISERYAVAYDPYLERVPETVEVSPPHNRVDVPKQQDMFLHQHDLCHRHMRHVQRESDNCDKEYETHIT